MLSRLSPPEKIPASRSRSIHEGINFVSNPVGCQQSCEKSSCQPENGAEAPASLRQGMTATRECPRRTRRSSRRSPAALEQLFSGTMKRSVRCGGGATSIQPTYDNGREHTVVNDATYLPIP